MKLTINQKLGSGFGIIILAVLISLYLNNRTGRKYQELQNKIMTVLTPSRDNLTQLSDMIATSTILTRDWSFNAENESDDKIALKRLHQTDFPNLRDSLISLSPYWTDDEKSTLQNISVAIEDTLFAKQRYVMEQLNNMDAYNDILVKVEIDPMLEKRGEIPLITQEINNRLGLLIYDFNQQAQIAQNQITADFTGFQRLIIITNIILIIIVLISATYSQFSIVQPLKKIDLLIGRLARGNLSEKSNIKQNDEIGMIATSVNTLIDGLRSTTNFANEIGKGHLDASFQTLSDDDILGNSLLNMRASLQRADTEEQKRKEEDDRRNWAAQGLARFAEILRNNNTDMEIMTHEVLYSLVRYIEANQGGIFVLNDSDPQHKYLEMRSCYAYDRKKFVEKQIEIGEGMVGTCFQEGETIYMTEVPHDYVEITSGLGGDTPTAILIVPLKVNEEVFGVLELAAFIEFQPYIKEFVEKISESIASTISSLKVSERTSMLLNQAKIQAQEMSEQEEELRQNMEELQATQEEWSRKEEEYESFRNAIEEAMLVIELSTDFELLRVNKNVVKKLGISENELLHNRYTDILSGDKDVTGQDYRQVWQRLRQGEVQETTDQLSIRGKTYICHQLFMPRRNNYREIYKYLCITAEIRQA
ncbi:MAG: GAF domain-containing protein [Bacteroidales bacterium]|jgi:methyl-accepting chemotaxis protein|nr:GAF domain-containing protein [Bacteroidales bacterium]